MSAQLRSELFKLRTARAYRWRLLAMLGLLALMLVLHVFSLSPSSLADREGQLKLLGLGTTFGSVFASLLGAMSMTSEIRHGTIRPTLLVNPRRTTVVLAKVTASAAAGFALGLVAELLAAAVCAAGFAGRGLDPAPSAARLAQLVVGGAVAAALWAAIGAAVGAVVRSQIGALVQQTSTYLLSPAVGALVIASRVLATGAAGVVATERRDFS